VQGGEDLLGARVDAGERLLVGEGARGLVLQPQRLVDRELGVAALEADVGADRLAVDYLARVAPAGPSRVERLVVDANAAHARLRRRFRRRRGRRCRGVGVLGGGDVAITLVATVGFGFRGLRGRSVDGGGGLAGRRASHRGRVSGLDRQRLGRGFVGVHIDADDGGAAHPAAGRDEVRQALDDERAALALRPFVVGDQLGVLARSDGASDERVGAAAAGDP